MRFPTGWMRRLRLGLVGLGLAVAAQYPAMYGQLSGQISGQMSGQQTGNPGIAQNPTLGQNPGGSGHGILNTADAPDPMSSAKQEAMRIEERQKRLVADTNRLQELATQLHADVAKMDQHTLPVDVVKRAEEIEKLARSVKERMKN